jgi:hypothetical protein
MTEAELHRLDVAPYDDEGLSDEDLRAVEEARTEAGISWSEAEAELTLADPGGWRIEIRPAALKSLRKLGRKTVGASPPRSAGFPRATSSAFGARSACGGSASASGASSSIDDRRRR